MLGLQAGLDPAPGDDAESAVHLVQQLEAGVDVARGPATPLGGELGDGAIHAAPRRRGEGAGRSVDRPVGEGLVEVRGAHRVSILLEGYAEVWHNDAAMRKVLVTGFPGFIARLLVRRIAPQAESVVLLVEERFRAEAERVARYLVGLFGLPPERFEIVCGDITRPDLGLEPADADRLKAEIDTVFHLAAIYELAVPYEIAHRVNVVGTENVNDFVSEMPALERYNYVSTFAVAGKRSGIIREHELEHDAGFNNHYESTKYHAEVAVRRAMEERRIPTSIFRPGVVVGSSRTGETVKYDGPYMVLTMMRDLPWPLSRLNYGSREIRFQVVPVDWLVEAIVTIAGRDDTAGKTFHLTDPAPHTTAEIFDLFCESLYGDRCLAKLPDLVTRAATLTGATTLLGLQREASEYMFQSRTFDCVNTLDALDGSGVECPRLEDYVLPVVRYFAEHPQPTA
jgi:thioester reductase-like protein